MSVNQVDGMSTGEWVNLGVQSMNMAVNAASTRSGRKWQERQMEAQQDFQREMYQRNLDDSIAWRQHNEEYNSPAAQMQRYKDAGINPMYAVTGAGGQTQVTTPMQANGSGYSRGNPQAYGHYQPLDAISMAQAKMLNAQANMYQADANKKQADADHQLFLNGIDGALAGLDFGGKSYHQAKAEVLAKALEYESQTQGMDFEEKKKVFAHNDILRNYDGQFKKEQLDELKSLVAKAKDEAEVARVAANWAQANQIIDASTDVLGVLLGFFGLARGRMPAVQERHYYGDSFNTINNPPKQ